MGAILKMKPWWLWLQLWPAGRGTNWGGGGGHFSLLIFMPNMVCILLLLSCQIVRLQAAGTKPTTSAACRENPLWITTVRQLSTALYVLKCSCWTSDHAPICDLMDWGMAMNCSSWFRVALKGLFDILEKQHPFTVLLWEDWDYSGVLSMDLKQGVDNLSLA